VNLNVCVRRKVRMRSTGDMEKSRGEKRVHSSLV